MYPSIPYAHKYANAVNEKGIFGALADTLSQGGSGGIVDMLRKGATTVIERDMMKVMQMLVDMELNIFRDLDVRVLFLQNIVTDLLMGLGNPEVFRSFADYVRDEHGVEPGFITMNLPSTVDTLLDAGIENPIVCSSINKAGYFMNPAMEAYEETLASKPFRPVAMSVLASGAVPPGEAIEYVTGLPGIQSVVFGASSRKHIAETAELIRGQLDGRG